jgi:hypothetical protein
LGSGEIGDTLGELLVDNMTTTDITFEDMLWFVMRNKTDKCFRGMNILQIAYILKQALDEGSLWYNAINGNITGMIVFSIDNNKKIIFVKHNLAMSIATLKQFAAKAKRDFGNYTFHWYRRDKHKVHTGKQLYKSIGV